MFARALVLSVLSSCFGAAWAATLTVSPTGTYKTLNSAVVAATTGDTIVINAGTYTTFVPDTKGKNLTVQGSGSATTILVGNGKNPVVTVKSGTVSFSGITIRNPYASASAVGGRSVLVSGGTVTISESVLSNSGSATLNGGAVYASAATLNLVNDTFSSNNGANGAHVAAAASANVTISGSDFSGGIASDKGGAISVDASSLQVTTSTFTGNTAANWGGAIRSTQASDLLITGATFTGNVSTNEQGGAISSAGNGSLDIHSSDFSSNTAKNGGGAIYFEEGALVVDDSTFTSNVSSIGAGGAIDILERVAPTDYGVTSLVIIDTTFTSNLSGLEGSHMAAYGITSFTMD